MAKKSWIARNKKKARAVAKYASKRAELKAAGDYEALSQLPRNASPVSSCWEEPRSPEGLEVTVREREREAAECCRSARLSVRLKCHPGHPERK